MTNLRRIDDVFPDAITGKGIFSYLDILPVPWKTAVESLPLDLQYHLNRSGCKIVSPVVEKLLGDETAVTDEVGTKLANILWSINKESWERLYATLSLEYNPIENYRMEENEETTDERSSSSTVDKLQTNNLSRTVSADNEDTEKGTVNVSGSTDMTHEVDSTKTTTGTNNDTQSGSVGVDTTDGGTVSVSGKNSSDTTSNVYGFNSQSAVPSDTGTSSGTSSTQTTNNLNGTKDTEFSIDTDKTLNETVTDKGSNTDKGTDTRDESRDISFSHKKDETIKDSGTITNEEESSDKTSGSGTRTLTRSGNIGVTTSQQMLESERELWVWKFFDQVFRDVDEILTLPIY